MSRIYEAFKRNEASQPVAVAEAIDGIPGLSESYDGAMVEQSTAMPSALARCFACVPV